MSDIDIITRALAAGQQAVVTLKATYRDGGSYAQARRMQQALHDGMDALKRLADKLPPDQQPGAMEFGTGLHHHDKGNAPHYVPLDGWDTSADSAAMVDAMTTGTGIVRQAPDGTRHRIDPADIRQTEPPAPAAPPPEVQW